jgi:hypothetical protein
MRLRVLYVEGMVRPLVVIDQASIDDHEVSAGVVQTVRLAMPGSDVLMAGESVDIPQLGEVES